MKRGEVTLISASAVLRAGSHKQREKVVICLGKKPRRWEAELSGPDLKVPSPVEENPGFRARYGSGIR
jgi:hypothetical protein